MSTTEEILNGLLVELFNDILKIEEKSIKSKDITDLTMNEIHTIEAIGIKKEKAMGEVANELKISVGTLTTSVSRLIQKGYVLRKKNNNDKRVVLISLTDKGKEIYEIHRVFHQEMIKYVINECSDSEQKLLTDLLKRIVSFFEKKYELLER